MSIESNLHGNRLFEDVITFNFDRAVGLWVGHATGAAEPLSWMVAHGKVRSVVRKRKCHADRFRFGALVPNVDHRDVFFYIYKVTAFISLFRNQTHLSESLSTSWRILPGAPYLYLVNP